MPHYFLEYDVLNLETKQFLSTKQRQKLLAKLAIASVPVLFTGYLHSHQQLLELLSQSHFIHSGHIDCLRQLCAAQGLDSDRALAQTNCSALMEGLYIKVESENWKEERYKYVRADFLTILIVRLS